MGKKLQIRLKERCRFSTSLRYELFYSLHNLTNPETRIHKTWQKTTLAALSSTFRSEFERIGSAWEIWPVLGATVSPAVATPTFEEIVGIIQTQPIEEFKKTILLGILHEEKIVAALIDKKEPLAIALAKTPKAKQEWLGYIGLFPFKEDAPIAIALRLLLTDATEFRAVVLRLIKMYWTQSFKRTWNFLQPEYERCRAEKERLFESCTIEEFSKQALIRVEFDEKKNEIHAIRGGYKLPFKNIMHCYFMPSAFNDRRYWSAVKDQGSQTFVYFPFFEPSINVSIERHLEHNQLVDPELDPAILFRALGDSTRFAIASILARSAKSSIELASILSVSKPTISHHVHQLREAGLLQENFQGGSVLLSLKRSVIESLSDLTIKKLFHSGERINLTKTRNQTA